MKILKHDFSRFHDPKTGVEFSPVLDFRTGCYVGIADVDDAAPFKDRGGFTVLSGAEWLAMTTRPAKPKAAPAPDVLPEPPKAPKAK